MLPLGTEVIDSLTLGGITIANQSLGAADAIKTTAGTRYDGILGYVLSPSAAQQFGD